MIFDLLTPPPSWCEIFYMVYKDLQDGLLKLFRELNE
jgi:hypothetical protein